MHSIRASWVNKENPAKIEMESNEDGESYVHK